MGNLFGYKKWYKVDKTIEKDGKTNTVKKEVRIKRNYLTDRYILNTNNKDKENVFLLLTHSSSETKEKLEILKKEAVKIYGNKVNTQQIEYLDSKVQLFINEIKDMDSKEIEEYLEKLEKEGLYFNFMTPPINMKKFNKADYIKYLESKSNFSNTYKEILKFIVKNLRKVINSV